VFGNVISDRKRHLRVSRTGRVQITVRQGVVAAVAFVSSSLAVSWSPPPPGPGTCTVLGGGLVATLAVVLVVCDVATDAAAASSVVVVVAVGGGSFKFTRGRTVRSSDSTGFVRAALAGGFFVLSVVLRLLFARSRAMLLSGMGVGIAGKPYIIVRCWDAKLWEHGWLGATCGCHGNSVVQT
jgi:hypothetical protein